MSCDFEDGDQIQHFVGQSSPYTYVGRVPNTDFHHIQNSANLVMTLSTYELRLHYTRVV